MFFEVYFIWKIRVGVTRLANRKHLYGLLLYMYNRTFNSVVVKLYNHEFVVRGSNFIMSQIFFLKYIDTHAWDTTPLLRFYFVWNINLLLRSFLFRSNPSPTTHTGKYVLFKNTIDPRKHFFFIKFCHPQLDIGILLRSPVVSLIQIWPAVFLGYYTPLFAVFLGSFFPKYGLYFLIFVLILPSSCLTISPANFHFNFVTVYIRFKSLTFVLSLFQSFSIYLLLKCIIYDDWFSPVSTSKTYMKWN